jgi:hypothetical protein
VSVIIRVVDEHHVDAVQAEPPQAGFQRRSDTVRRLVPDPGQRRRAVEAFRVADRAGGRMSSLPTFVDRTYSAVAA